MTPTAVYLQSLGCAKNRVDSEVIVGALPLIYAEGHLIAVAGLWVAEGWQAGADGVSHGLVWRAPVPHVSAALS